MASVAICPHCYLQLIVPDGVEPAALVECPTCTKQFQLAQATLRTIPEIAIVQRAPTPPPSVSPESPPPLLSPAESRAAAPTIDYIEGIGEAPSAAEIVPLESTTDDDRPHLDTVGQADVGVAAWFGARTTIPDVPPVPEANAGAETNAAEAKTLAENPPEQATGDEVEMWTESADLQIEPLEPRTARPSAITLSEIMPPRREPEEESLSGPSFDLPNVSLTRGNGATVEIESDLPLGAAAYTEFQLDDVDFESTPVDAESATLAEFPAVDDAAAARLSFAEPELPPASETPVFVPAVGRRRRRSAVGTLVGTALGGVVGLTLGYYALLYLLGPQSDFLKVAQYLPPSMLPPSFQSATTETARADTTTAPPAEVPTDLANNDDAAAEPASYSESADESEGGKADVATYLDESSETKESPTGPASYDSDVAGAASPPPVQGPTYSLDQLETALDEAESAQAGLITGDLRDAAVRRTKGLSYAKLCDLAHALTFFDRSSPAERAAELQGRAERLFRETLSDSHARGEVARIASIWIESPHRRHSGLFLAGNVSGGEIAGDVYEYQLATEDGSELTLLMPQPLDPQIDASGQPLGIVGAIVEDPSDEISGYSGAASRAIWVHSVIPLE